MDTSCLSLIVRSKIVRVGAGVGIVTVSSSLFFHRKKSKGSVTYHIVRVYPITITCAYACRYFPKIYDTVHTYIYYLSVSYKSSYESLVRLFLNVPYRFQL